MMAFNKFGDPDLVADGEDKFTGGVVRLKKMRDGKFGIFHSGATAPASTFRTEDEAMAAFRKTAVKIRNCAMPTANSVVANAVARMRARNAGDANDTRKAFIRSATDAVKLARERISFGPVNMALYGISGFRIAGKNVDLENVKAAAVDAMKKITQHGEAIARAIDDVDKAVKTAARTKVENALKDRDAREVSVTPKTKVSFYISGGRQFYHVKCPQWNTSGDKQMVLRSVEKEIANLDVEIREYAKMRDANPKEAATAKGIIAAKDGLKRELAAVASWIKSYRE